MDQSAELLAHAERDRGETSKDRLRYARHDLRQPLREGVFDAALNVFTSIGYGTEQDDFAILATIFGALRPGGLALIEAIQRDAVSAFFAHGGTLAPQAT